MSDQAARDRIDRWKQALINRPTDRLLHLGDDSGAIPLAIDPVRIAFAMVAGSTLAITADTSAVDDGWASGDPADASTLHAALEAAELSRRLVELRRAAHAARAEADHVLWFGLGLLAYVQDDGTTRTAPLALWPVELVTGSDGVRRVRAAAGMRPRYNDHLIEVLRRDHELVIETADELDLGLLFDQLGPIVACHDGWLLNRSVVLMQASFAAFDLWRDLETRGEDLYLNPPLQWLAGSLTPPALYVPAGQDVLAPLDADAGQLAAITAAGAGGSFVLDGAPGTGKSQTIANLVVHCASNGKRVLVVSDRASALDVVLQRLSTIGLGELCLPLHAGRARVLGSLARVFERSFRPATQPSSAGDDRLSDLRRGLDAFATALHRVGPLGMSVHEALGRLVELRGTPHVPLAERDAAAMDKATFARRKAAVTSLAEAAISVEPVAAHPWRTSALEAWPAEGTDRATRALDEMIAALDDLASAITDVSALVPGIVARTPEQLRALATFVELAAASPRPGAELLTNMRGRHDEIGERVALIRARGAGTLDVPRDPGSFLAIATRHRALVAEVRELFTDAIEELDVAELCGQLKKWTGSMAALRYVALRNARAAVRAAAHASTALETDEAMIAALETVFAERACREALLGAAEPARRWFGDLGGEALSLDLDRIEHAVTWGTDLRKAFDQLTLVGGEAGRQVAWRAFVAQVSASPDAADGASGELAPFARLAAAIGRWAPALAEVAAATGIGQDLLGAGADHLAALREQVTSLRQAVGSLADWARFHLARRDAVVAGIGPAIETIERGALLAAQLAPAWELATLILWCDLEISETPALAQFHGPSHHAQVTAFADLDRGALALTRARVVSRLADRLPRTRDLTDPELATLRAELDAKKPRTLRALLADIPTLWPRITPVVLATPHALAAHLAGDIGFDLVVFDEASRLPAAHALGALARGTSAIVVGDSRQVMAEGLLELALAANLPRLTLGAHYRSRHEDLFAFSNHQYYGDRLEVLPAPSRSSDLGVSWRKIDAAGEPEVANRIEAETIVAELRARLADPVQRTRSYAVVALTAGQQRLLEDTLDAACEHDAQLAAALASDGEYLLVGTPERMQGEERDVVYVSVGDATSALATLMVGGQRWLDVAISRAREQMVLVSSFAPEDMVIEPPAARDLSDLLAFARAGGGASKPADDVSPASPVTAAIAQALTERGWTLRHQVGCGAYKLDLAVVDPNDPDRYVLAIEHDGAAYASSLSARSRDRLRAQLLGGLGWRVHRIWSIDWWIDTEREIQRAHGAIVAAIAASRQRRPGTTVPPRTTGSVWSTRTRASSLSGRTPAAPVIRASSPATPDETVPTAVPQSGAVALAAGSGPTDAIGDLPAGSGPISKVKIPRGAIAIGPYMAAAVPAGRRAPDDMFLPRYANELGKCIEQVLATEAPIHVELLARRVGAYFGVGKVTPRVLEQVKLALAGRGRIGDEPSIVWRKDQDPEAVPAVRVAGHAPTARRDIAEVPLTEVAAAARIVVERASGVSTTDLVRDCARLLGFARITDQVTSRVALGVRLAEVRELIAVDAGKASLKLD